MKLRRYCVTVMDNYTPTREFVTLDRAYWFYKHHQTSANLFGWENGKWVWMFGADKGGHKPFVDR